MVSEPQLMPCPICEQLLPTGAIRCHGCSVLIGAPSSSAQFARGRRRAMKPALTLVPWQQQPSIRIALFAVITVAGVLMIVACV